MMAISAMGNITFSLCTPEHPLPVNGPKKFSFVASSLSLNPLPNPSPIQ